MYKKCSLAFSQTISDFKQTVTRALDLIEMVQLYLLHATCLREAYGICCVDETCNFLIWLLCTTTEIVNSIFFFF